MRRILVLLMVVAPMVVMLALPAFAASQKGCFAAQRSADASGRTGLVSPPFPNEGTYLSTRHERNSNLYEPHTC
jgi:hypothetical protein